MRKKHSAASKAFELLRALYPDAKCELDYSNPLELLVATILSAQCTDVRVNIVTKELFRLCKEPADYLKHSQKEIEGTIRSTGFYRQKAKNIRRTMEILLEKHGGKVPTEMKDLTLLPGVGRKTANVIRGNAYSLPGLPVDTHVRRVCRRIGLTENENPEKIESDLCGQLPEADWTLFSHTVIFHGRRVCNARKPRCEVCPIAKDCLYFTSHSRAHLPKTRKEKNEHTR